ncbi:hypothetical protein [Aeromicrobium sp.]|uniref:hypothetical protein n=1 Tax=Aeromicrobium sp. TaxID=1871063 RepID=UPI0028A6924E|nr:hypothetical protein [Aeromicrobium sp.]
MHSGGNRIATSALVLSAVLLLGACGDDDSSEPSPAAGSGSSASTGAPSSAPGPTSTRDDEARVLAVLEAYWDERIRVETSGDFASADYGSIMTDEAAEPTLERYRQLATGNFRRVGKPELRDHSAVVTGDTAVASVCVNEDEWGARADAEIVEIEPAGWYAESHRLRNVDGTWLIVGDAGTPDGFAC